jgi:hypothetical protein
VILPRLRFSHYALSLMTACSLNHCLENGDHYKTTQIYLDADLAMKQAVLDKTKPPEGKPGRYRPDDPLLAFLKGL